MILENQGREKEGQAHRQILERLKQRHLEKFGTEATFSGIGIG